MAAVALLASAAVFAFGARAEADTHTSEPAAAVDTHDESGTEAVAHDEAGSDAAHHDSAETILGVETNSPGVVGGAILASVALAGLAWSRPRRWVWLAIVVFAAGAAVLDVRELLHQLDRSSTGIALAATTAAAGHAIAIAAGATALRREPGSLT